MILNAIMVYEEMYEIENFQTNSIISISHSKGIRLLKIRDIIYLKATDSYTAIYFGIKDGFEKFVSSKNLGDFESMLPGDIFFRIHKSYIVNVLQMKEFLNDHRGYVIMNNETEIEVSRRKSGAFKIFLKKLNKIN